MKVTQLVKDSSLSHDILGGKAYNLQQLIAWDLNVPRAFVITADNVRQLLDITDEAILREISVCIERSPSIHYAVRSSGIGEDGAEHSFAGIFETELGVAYSDLPKAIRRVYESKETSVTSMYSEARKVSVSEMAIVIQEMVNADYAGVAFSVSPVEIDKRVGLIEIVKGIGESLVSGKTKPTSIRINKLTGMHRVLQAGSDTIKENVALQIIGSVGKTLQEVERLYDQPIDIEWAVKNNELYLLQARPITTLGELK